MEYEYRELDGFTYHLSLDPTKYLREWLRAEWLQDAAEYPDQLWTNEWLHNVERLKFRVEIISLNLICPRQELMEYKEEGYSFKKELKERVRERIPAIRMGTSIMPLVIRDSDKELLDGYTRYIALKQLGAQRVYGYIGS